MNELSLFTGAGGGLLGTHLLGWRPVGYVEWNEYCQRVIAARITDGYLPVAPIFTDVREFAQSGAADEYRGVADVVTAGFPCQPFSVAGKQLAADDERNMWPATREVIRRIQPRSVLLENVPGLVSCGYLGTVICDLAALGYVGRWGVMGAADAGAPHKRDRLWVVAHTKSQRRPEERGNCERSQEWASGCCEVLAHADTARRQEHDAATVAGGAGSPPRTPVGWWASDPGDDPESGVGRVAARVAHGMDRLTAIGNGQVPAVVERAWRELAA